MSFEAVEQEIVSWDDAKLRKLQALVVVLRSRHADRNLVEKLRSRIDDQSPNRWITAEEFSRRLNLVDGSPDETTI
jgi:hypothetical protein